MHDKLRARGIGACGGLWPEERMQPILLDVDTIAAMHDGEGTISTSEPKSRKNAAMVCISSAEKIPRWSRNDFADQEIG